VAAGGVLVDAVVEFEAVAGEKIRLAELERLMGC